MCATLLVAVRASSHMASFGGSIHLFKSPCNCRGSVAEGRATQTKRSHRLEDAIYDKRFCTRHVVNCKHITAIDERFVCCHVPFLLECNSGAA